MASEPVFRQLDRHLSIHTPAFKWQITFLSRRHHLVSKTPVNSTSLIQELAMALLSLRLRGSLFLSSSLFSHRRLSRPDMTIFEGCYYNHWLITMELPNDSKPTPEVMAETYVQAPAKVIGSLNDVLCKVFYQNHGLWSSYENRRFSCVGHRCIHSGKLNMDKEVVGPKEHCEAGAIVDGNSNAKVKRKKLKGKRAVVRWLKYFRWKKKKEYERMTVEEKILYKLGKAQKKEARLMEALKKIEPQESSEATHDPEILTPEEHFYFLKMGLKCKNYVPIGRRGIFQGVILNMHLHWKKHQTLKVIVKTFTPEEVKEIAAELARLSGGIVLDIHEENTIIMYRGKNYSQPPTEIMSPRITLSRKKALDKSKYRDGLRAVRKFIPRLQQDLELLQVKARMNHENGTDVVNESIGTVIDKNNHEPTSDWQPESSDKLRELLDGNDDFSEDDSSMESDKMSDSEALSDIFETDSDEQADEEAERSLYLDEFDKFPIESNGEPEDFEDHLRQISLNSRKDDSLGKDEGLPDLDEVDRIFLRAGSLLRKKRK